MPLESLRGLVSLLVLISLLLPLLAATSLTATPDIRLAAVGFRAVDVDAKKADFFGSVFAQRLAEASKLPVSTPEEIGAVLGLERQRQLMGCTEQSTSCIAEIAGGLGVSGMVLGTVAKVGSQWALTVKVVDTRDARSLSARSGQVETEAAVLTWLAEAARAMAPEVRAALVPGERLPTARSGRFLETKAWIPTAAGGALLVTGGVFYALALSTAASISEGSQSIRTAEELQAALTRGRTENIAGASFLIAGAAALVVSGALLLFAPEPKGFTISVAAFPHGLGARGQF